MATKQEVRALASLVASASTARVLNLVRHGAQHGATTPAAKRMFRNGCLERSLIVKHRLRSNERDWFVAPKRISTKILVPVDPLDLSFGANAIFVNQKGYDEALTQVLGIDADPEAGARDRALLAALDELPSLDPFLTREQLSRKGFDIQDDYFDLSEGDIQRMTEFVRADIVPLVSLCFGGTADAGVAEKLSNKILKAELDASMEPLRATLRMDGSQFIEGIFCWKGFLYYKWTLRQVLDAAKATGMAINRVQPFGEMTYEEETFIPRAKKRVRDNIEQACHDAQGTLATYDRAFAKLTQHADPVGFRDFLLAAPNLFCDVGEKLAAIQHITSFWAYKFPVAQEKLLATDLFDILADFDGCFPQPIRLSTARWVA